MHKLSDASFKREGDDGETTVEGYLAIQPPEDQDYTAGRNIGAVVFVVKPEGDEPQPTTAAADDDDKESDKPQSQSQQRRNR